MPHPAQVHFTKPDAGQIERGGKYVSFIDNTPASSGAIFCSSNTPLWRYETRPLRGARNIANLLRKPDFILSDTEHREIIRISRERRFPARFSIVEKNQTVGHIALSSLLRNSYSVEFSDSPGWLFHLRLFTVWFHGESSAGKHVWIRMGPTKRQWNLLVEPEADNVHLLAALAFIHREWWAYN